MKKCASSNLPGGFIVEIENQKIIDPSPLQINSIADQIFKRLALQFPVCMASDEFHFVIIYHAHRKTL
ncbi:MAG: hypothetical protein QF876_00555 [Desulfobacterales bacterium]|nr:hypothetical protein [Desulfobacter sp.]MDP6681480.1 hypothetical protein [Desulfobacterales bacterium]MDP6808909.1 hypothetical protein [Desulfobacterales bacterium]